MKVLQINNARALHADNEGVWLARGMKYWKAGYDGHPISRTFSVGGAKDKILSLNRLTRQLLRVGIHHMVPLSGGNLLVSTKKKTYIVDANGQTVNTFEGFRGNKPAQFGICEDDEGNIFFGEYTINLSNDHPTSLYRSTDGGKSFNEIYKFDSKEIRHIHFVQWDKYAKCLWMGTGDKDFECLLMRSFDHGDTWERVGGGSQQWRAIGVVFTRDYLYWGTDAGSVPDQNYIVRMNRADNTLEIIAELDGPCHGIASNNKGEVFVCAGVEGGENERDSYARLYRLKDGKISELCKMKKDIFPMILQYGVIHFPHGLEDGDKVVFTSFGLSGGGEKTFLSED